MATGSVTIGVTLSPTNSTLKGSSVLSSSVSYVSGSLPSNATITSGYMTFNSITVYTTSEPTFEITNDSTDTLYAESSELYSGSGEQTLT